MTFDLGSIKWNVFCKKMRRCDIIKILEEEIMQLVVILMICVGILAFLTGIMISFGAARGKRTEAGIFGLATTAGFLWTISIGTFLSLQPDQMELAEICVYGIYVSGLFVILLQAIYSGWGRRYNAIMSVVFLLATVVLTALLIYDPSILYSGIILSSSGNKVEIVTGWYYVSYAVLGMMMMSMFIFNRWYNKRRGRTVAIKRMNGVTMWSLMICGVLAAIFDFILPAMGNYELIWIGPLGFSVAVIGYYYVTLRYRLFSLNSNWLKILSYIVLMLTGAIVYMVLFFLIFTALFKIPNPSAEVIMLNFIMIVIVLLLMPVMMEASAFVRSLIYTHEFDIAYVVKKLNHLATSNVNLNELSGFLAEHLHFQYIGLVVDGKLYGTGALGISADELIALKKLKSEENGTWLKAEGGMVEVYERLGSSGVAELKSGKGKAFGLILVGKPVGKRTYTQKDLIQIEMIINLVAVVIDSEKRPKTKR